jgi:hypothetical protein
MKIIGYLLIHIWLISILLAVATEGKLTYENRFYFSSTGVVRTNPSDDEVQAALKSIQNPKITLPTPDGMRGEVLKK